MFGLSSNELANFTETIDTVFEELHRNSALHNDGGDDDNDKGALFGLDRWNKIACIKAAFRSLSRDTDFVSDASDFKRLHSHAKKHSRLPHAFDVLSAVMHGDSTDDKVRLLSAKQRVLDAWEDAVEVLRLSHRNSFLTSIEHRKKNSEDTSANTNSTNAKPSEQGRFCGGIIDDIKRRSLVYASDWTDGLQTVKTITATLYMYFGCLGPAIAFGGLTYEETGGKLGDGIFALPGFCRHRLGNYRWSTRVSTQTSRSANGFHHRALSTLDDEGVQRTFRTRHGVDGRVDFNFHAPHRVF